MKSIKLKVNMKRFSGVGVVLIVLGMAGCNGCGDGMPADAESFASQMQDLQEDMKENFNDSSVETVDTEDLQAMMPSSAAGMKRTDFKNNSTGAFGFKVATSTSEYEEGNRNVTITITDAGTMKAAVKAANTWMDNDFEETTSNGYSRTGEFFGYRGMEKYESGSYGSKAELSIFVADRFVVHATGRNVSMDDVKDAVEDVKLNKLKRQG